MMGIDMIEITGPFYKITDRSVVLVRSNTENGIPGKILEQKL